MNTKVYMVTGATSGLGKAIALELAKTGENLIMVARDPERGARVQREISTAAQNPKRNLRAHQSRLQTMIQPAVLPCTMTRISLPALSARRMNLPKAGVDS